MDPLRGGQLIMIGARACGELLAIASAYEWWSQSGSCLHMDASWFLHSSVALRAPLALVRKTNTPEFQFSVIFSCQRSAAVRGKGAGKENLT